MTQYIQVTNGVAQIYSPERLRKDNPNVSFPSALSPEILASYNVFECPIPTNPANPHVERGDLRFRQVDGVWEAYWVMTPLPAGEADRARELWRSEAVLSRRQFCIAAFRAGLLPGDQAAPAAKGEWPDAFAQALTGLPAETVIEAQIEWATVTEVRRSAPLLEAVRMAGGVTHEQLDTLFGWQGAVS